MSEKLYFCVVQGYDDAISVCSFGGRNKAQERRFARNGNQVVYLVTTDYDEAQRRAARLREALSYLREAKAS